MVERIMSEMPKTNLALEDEALLYVKLSDTNADEVLTKLILENDFSVRYKDCEYVNTRGGNYKFGFWFNDTKPFALGITRAFMEQVREDNTAVIERLSRDLKKVALIQREHD